MKLFEGLKTLPNIHPLFVHFPIALLLTSLFLFVLALSIKRNQIFTIAKWNLIIGTLSGVITVITGFIAARSVPHNHEIHMAMITHRNLMLTTVIISLALSIYIFDKKECLPGKKGIIFLIGTILMAACLTIGADFGGKMVFKYGVATELYLKLNPEIDSNDQHQEHDHGHD